MLLKLLKSLMSAYVFYLTQSLMKTDVKKSQVKLFFVDLPLKIAAATIYFAINNFPPFLCFSQLVEGAPNSIFFCTLLFFVTFWFVSLTRQAFEFNKFCENCEKSRLQRFVAL